MSTKTFLERAYLAYFGRPPDVEGSAFYANKTEPQVLQAFLDSQESRNLYPDFGVKFIDAVYSQLFNHPAYPEGSSYFTAQLSKVSPPQVAVDILNMVLEAPIPSPDAIVAKNKLATVEQIEKAIFLPLSATAQNSLKLYLSNVGMYEPSPKSIALAVDTALHIDAYEQLGLVFPIPEAVLVGVTPAHI